MTWRSVTLEAIQRLCHHKQSRQFTRQELLEHQLSHIVVQTASTGATPEQTVSRVLQELRAENYLYFLDNAGSYWYVGDLLPAEAEPLPDEVLDFAIQHHKLQFTDINTHDTVRLSRQRQGQQRLRTLTLANYQTQCALCDLTQPELLVTSHIVRWADALEHRGQLSNVICFCVFHDLLFEKGYLSLDDQYQPLYRPVQAQAITALYQITTPFRSPLSHPPAAEFLRRHRIRTGFEHL